MKALILAAGKGERMRPLTDNLPKPLLDVNGKTLLDHQIDKLVAADVSHIIVNAAYLGHLIEHHIRSHAYPVPVSISREPQPLETAGAIAYALDVLGDEPFLLVNGDVWMDMDYRQVMSRMSNRGGHLVLVENPPHRTEGDFSLDGDLIRYPRANRSTYTFSGVSVLCPSLVRNFPERREVFPLREVFYWAIESDLLTGNVYQGNWMDVGTPERLEALRQQLAL